MDVSAMFGGKLKNYSGYVDVKQETALPCDVPIELRAKDLTLCNLTDEGCCKKMNKANLSVGPSVQLNGVRLNQWAGSLVQVPKKTSLRSNCSNKGD